MPDRTNPLKQHAEVCANYDMLSHRVYRACFAVFAVMRVYLLCVCFVFVHVYIHVDMYANVYALVRMYDMYVFLYV